MKKWHVSQIISEFSREQIIHPLPFPSIGEDGGLHMNDYEGALMQCINIQFCPDVKWIL